MGSMIKTRFTPVVLKPIPLAPKPPPAYADDVAEKAQKKAGASSAKASGKTAPRQRGSGLRACPFCRELFTDDETETCPECGLVVKDLAALPPSADAEALTHEEGVAQAKTPTIPQAEPLPWKDFTRGRGLLMVCAVVGLVAFYLPWAIQTMPETTRYTGAELAKARGFFWASFTSWLVLLPAVMSRRTLLKMVGARLVCTMLAAAPGIQCLFLLSRPTRLVVKGLPFEYHWGPGLFLTLAVSVVATFFALRFGGRLDDVKVAHGSSKGETVH
jgi:hypothetical protein